GVDRAPCDSRGAGAPSRGARPPVAVAEQPAPGRSQGRRRLIIAGLVVLAALGFLVVRGLGNATLYFRTADEAVAQKQQLGDRRFRIEGAVTAGTVRQTGDRVSFTIESKGVSVPVQHQGDQPELFK